MKNWIDKNKNLDRAKEDYLTTAKEIFSTEPDKLWGAWTVKEITDHILGWEEVVIKRFIQFINGNDEEVKYDIDKLNQEAVSIRFSQSFSDSVDEFEELNKRYHEILTTIKDEHLTNEKFMEWIDILIDHYKYHTQQLKSS